MSSTTLYLVRHGEVDVGGNFYGHMDVQLSPQGRLQAEEVARALAAIPLQAVQASDLTRAAEGARLIAERHGLTVAVDPAYREMSLGLLEGVPYAEARRRHPELADKKYSDMHAYRFPGGGENLADVEARAWPALERFLQANTGGTVALVAHNSVNRFILGRALGLELRDVFDFAQDFCCVNKITYTEDKDGHLTARVLLMNWTPDALLPDSKV